MHFRTKLFSSGTLTQNINKSGETLVNIGKDLKLFYINQLDPNRHTLDDPFHGTSNILDMAFLSPGLSSRDISFNLITIYRSQLMFRSGKHEVHTIEVNKIDLNRDDDKRISEKDGISTLALGNKSLSWSPILGELSLR